MTDKPTYNEVVHHSHRRRPLREWLESLEPGEVYEYPTDSYSSIQSAVTAVQGTARRTRGGKIPIQTMIRDGKLFVARLLPQDDPANIRAEAERIRQKLKTDTPPG